MPRSGIGLNELLGGNATTEVGARQAPTPEAWPKPIAPGHAGPKPVPEIYEAARAVSGCDARSPAVRSRSGRTRPGVLRKPVRSECGRKAANAPLRQNKDACSTATDPMATNRIDARMLLAA